MKTFLSNSAIAYTWDQIFYRLGIKGDKPNFLLSGKKVSFLYRDFNKTGNSPDQFQINILSCKPDDLDHLLKDPGFKLAKLDKKDFLPPSMPEFPIEKLPILFWGESSTKKSFAKIQNKNQLDIQVDLIASVFFMLSRWEEYFDATLDTHGRYPFKASAASRLGFINLPIVDLYVKVFKYWLEAMTHDEINDTHQFRISLSHDLDYVSLFRPAFKGITTLIRDSLKLNTKNFNEDIRILFSSYHKDPFYYGIKTLAEQSAKYGFSSAFNIMATSPSLYDAGYSLTSPIAKEILKVIYDKGHQIGLHASYYSLNNPDKLMKEKSRLEKFAGSNIDFLRSHYLRLNTPESWNNWQSAGIHLDTSYGFSEHEGFRCGTCFPYQTFDVLKDKPLDIIEEPLIVMDTTLKGYRNLSITQAKQSINQLANLCKFVHGNFTLLWHNTSFFKDWADWGIEYPEILSGLKDLLTGG